jgi:protein-tyrosine kinase
MSRIDEARKRAGLGGSPADEIHRTNRHALEAFPVSSEVVPERSGRGEEVRDQTTLGTTTAPTHSRRAVGIIDSLVAEKLVVHKALGQYDVEQYRRLAAGLLHKQQERGIKTIMVTSAQAGEGKTLTAANLSLTLSESYRRRVLLIDADLRRPSLDRLLLVPSPTGLSDCLRVHDGRPLQLIDVSEHLKLLPGGRPEADPMAVLSSARMREILQQAMLQFDWVILDTPPVALLPDAQVLASMVEATVFVIQAASTPYAIIHRAIGTLGADKIIGVVLNRVEERVVKAEGYYGYYAGERSPTGNSWWRVARGADEGQVRGGLGLSPGSRSLSDAN